MRAFRESCHHAYLGFGGGIGGVDDAEGGFSARNEHKRGADVLGPRDLVLHGRPHAQCLQCRLGVLACRDAIRVGQGEPLCAERRGQRKIGADLQRDTAVRWRDQHQAIAQQIDATLGGKQMARLEIGHPVEVGGNEHVHRRSGFDLFRQCVAGGVGNHDLVTRAGLELLDLIIQRLFEARCGEYGDRRTVCRERREQCQNCSRCREGLPHLELRKKTACAGMIAQYTAVYNVRQFARFHQRIGTSLHIDAAGTRSHASARRRNVATDRKMQ